MFSKLIAWFASVISAVPPSDNPYASPAQRQRHNVMIVGIDFSLSVKSVAQAMHVGYTQLKRKLVTNSKKLLVTLYSVAGQIREMTVLSTADKLPDFSFAHFANRRGYGKGLLEPGTSICRFLIDAITVAVELEKKSNCPAIFLVTDGQPSDATPENIELLRAALRLAKERGIAIYINCFLYRHANLVLQSFQSKLLEQNEAIRWDVEFIGEQGADAAASAVNAFQSMVDNIDRAFESR